MVNDYEEVLFDQYCPSCKHGPKKEEEHPCVECLDEPLNLHSHKPTKWEEKK